MALAHRPGFSTCATRSGRAFPVSRALLTLVLLASAPSLGVCGESLALDAGGFSIRYSERDEPVGSVGSNLVGNGGFETVESGQAQPKGWQCVGGAYTRDKEFRDRVNPLVAPFMETAVSQEGPHRGHRCASLSTSEQALEIVGQKASLCQMCMCVVEIPASDKGQKYAFSFHYRGTLRGTGGRSLVRAQLGFFDRPSGGRATRRQIQGKYMPTAAWQEGRLDFVAPRNTRAISIRLRLDGADEVFIDDVSLVEAEMAKGVDVRLIPFAFLDRVYNLSTDDVGLAFFGMRNESGVKMTTPRVVVELPSAVGVLAPCDGAELVAREAVGPDDGPLVRYTFDVKQGSHRTRRGDYLGHVLTLALQTSQPAGARLPEARYWYADGEYQTPPLSFSFRVRPSLRAKQPSRFLTSPYFTPADSSFEASPEVHRALAAKCVAAGFTAAHLKTATPKLSTALREAGLRRFVQPPFVANGYTIGFRDKPTSVRFQFADGRHHETAICPVAVYDRSDYLDTVVVPAMGKLLVQDRFCESFMCNWEPYMYNDKGCFCGRCKDEFVRYSKMDREEVERAWPTGVLEEHCDLWYDFRAWQHGRLVVTLEDVVYQLGLEAGIQSHFIPEIAWPLLAPGWKGDRGWRQCAAMEYAHKIPIIAPWAPYHYHDFWRPYPRLPGRQLETLCVAERVTAYVRGTIAEDQRPRLIAFPHSWQGSHVAAPEGIAMDALSYFVGGYHGYVAYAFPKGYDARYWRALAGANALIAQFEDLVMTGEKTRDHSIELVTPVPKVAVPHKLWGMQDLRIVQSREWRKGDARLLAIGNFWEWGECFVKLKVGGLSPESTYALSEPAEGRCYAGSDGQLALNARELGTGILLHVGALRYAFFVLRPFRAGQDYGKPVPPQAMLSAVQHRLPEITEALRVER